MTRIINTIKSPCLACDGMAGCKNNARCARCDRRVAYVAALNGEVVMDIVDIGGLPAKGVPASGDGQGTAADGVIDGVLKNAAPVTVREFTCTKCGLLKPETDFYRDKRMKTGRKGFCKICEGEAKKARKAKKKKRGPIRAKKTMTSPAEKTAKEAVRSPEGGKRNIPRPAGAVQTLLAEAGKVINGGRQDVYGNPEDSFALIAAYWETYLSGRTGSLRALDVAHMMVLFKIARLAGQGVHRDTYIDMAGYTAIAADRLAAEHGKERGVEK